jgi:hypothetical protein
MYANAKDNRVGAAPYPVAALYEAYSSDDTLHAFSSDDE